MGATNQFGDSELRSAKQHIKEWNRAIPEAGYITLGTIRYGVKFSVDNNSRDSAASYSAAEMASCGESTSGSGCCHDCCCIGGVDDPKTRVRPVVNGSNGRTMLPVPNSSNSSSKNRTLSQSPSSTASASSSTAASTATIASTLRPTIKPTSTSLCTSPAVGDRLVIGSRESSPPPPTCCYYSVPTKIAQPFKPSSSPHSLKQTAPSLQQHHHQPSASESSGYRILSCIPDSSNDRKTAPPQPGREKQPQPQQQSFQNSRQKPVAGGGGGGGGGSSIVRPNYCHQQKSSTRASQASNASLLSSSQSNSDDRRVDSCSVVGGGYSPTFNNSTDWIGNEASSAKRNLNAAGRDHHNQPNHHRQIVRSLCANLNLVKCATHGCCPSIDSADLNTSCGSSSDYTNLSECPDRSSSSVHRHYVNGPPSPSGQRLSAASSTYGDRLVQSGKSDPRSIISKTPKLSVRLTKNCVGFSGEEDVGEDDANRKHDTKITQIPHDKLAAVTGTDIKNTTRTTTNTTQATTTTTPTFKATKSSRTNLSTSASSHTYVTHDDAAYEYDVDADAHIPTDRQRFEEANHTNIVGHNHIHGVDDDACAAHPDYDDLSFIDSSAGDFSSASEVNQSDHNIIVKPKEEEEEDDDEENHRGALTISAGIPKSSELDCGPKINSVTLKSCYKNINNNNIYKQIVISDLDSESIHQSNLDGDVLPPYLPPTRDQGDISSRYNKSRPISDCIQPPSNCPSTKVTVRDRSLRSNLIDPSVKHNRSGQSTQSDTNTMENKRHKTLQRWQRLGFSRSSASTPPADTTPSHSSEPIKSEKTERLKELTEMLKGVRAPQTPPPIPPPRKPRSPNPVGGSIPSLVEPSTSSHQHSTASVPNPSEHRNMFHDSLKAISKSFRSSHQDVHSVEGDFTGGDLLPSTLQSEDDGDQFTALPHTRFQNTAQSHKNIPHRSASFSQVDYSSGKYIRTVLGAFKSTIMKPKEPTVVENANLTLPRKKESAHQSTEDKEFEEKYIFLTDNPNRNSLPIQSSSCFDTPPPAAPEPLPKPLVIVNASEMTLDTLCEEEIHVQQPNEHDEYLQTATTCLIPVPVYECVGRDWNYSEESDAQWIAANEEEPLIEVTANTNQTVDETSAIMLPNSMEIDRDSHIYDIPSELNCKDSGYCCDDQVVLDTIATSEQTMSEDRNKFERANTWSPSADAEPVPEISVTPGSTLELEQTNAEDAATQEDIVQHRLSTEYVEVRKRHSNEDKFDKLVDSSQTSLDSNNPNPNDERRKIDKSKRRKGMYIQWPVLDKQKSFDSCDWNPIHDSPLLDPTSTLWPCDPTRPDILIENPTGKSNPVLASKENSAPGNLFLLCKSPEENQTPFFDPTTPDSEYSIQAVWPKPDRRQSLTGQSSEEKDEHPIISASPSIRSFNKLNYLRSDSISDTESDRNQMLRDRCSQSPAPNDQEMKRYYKRPLRGPYGQMLEAEMNKLPKPEYDEILEELNKTDSPNKSKESAEDYLRHQKLIRKNSGYLPVPSHTRASSTPVHMDTSRKEVVTNHRRFPSYIDSTTDIKKEFKKMSLDSSGPTTSKDNLRSPKKCTSLEANMNSKRSSKEDSRLAQHQPSTSRDDSINTLKATPELLAQLLKGSSEKLVAEQHQLNKQKSGVSVTLPTAVLKCFDTRTHVVVELFNTEQSYVESLETVVLKYLNPLKSSEYSMIVDSHTVDEIFMMVPSILKVHERFLNDLKTRLDSWDKMQQVGDAFIEVFSATSVLETYAKFVNNWNRAKDAIRLTSRERPAFSKFLEAMSREHKGKLSLDNLLIKPVQKFPNYELILSRLIKNTDVDHPDQKPLTEALKLVHDILLHLNCKEREALENGQREALLREIEVVIEGVSDLVTPERQFLLFELVSVVSAGHTTGKERKERGLFLFNDQLIVTSTKRRSGNVKKPPYTHTCPGSLAATLETFRYKLVMRIPIEDLEIIRARDENVRKCIKEMTMLSNDCAILQQLADISATLKCPHQALEENIKELQRDLQRQLVERQANDTLLCLMELTITLSNESQIMSVMFPKPDKKTQWELALIEAKKQIALKCPPIPEFVNYVPIRKTRAGLQFTCAAPTLGSQKDVWLCNSDGYVGQVCVLSMDPEPNVTSCNSVCNARILCVASVPTSQNASFEGISVAIDDVMNALSPHAKLQKPDQSSSEEDSDVEVAQRPQSSASTVKLRDSHSLSDDMDSQQSTMWMGMEDGFINVYNCTDNIRIKNTKIKIPHASPVFAILYFNNCVYVSLANGHLFVYQREQGIWDTSSPQIIQISTAAHPVTRLLSVHGKIWCSVHGTIKILETTTLTIEHEFKVSEKLISNMVFSGNCVWMSMKNSAVVECYHAENFGLVHKLNVTPQVTKMLAGCDEIIKQHKAACMRVTSLMACKDTVWVGTSAGVLLTIHKSTSTLDAPNISGIPYGHTGHVRVLTCVQSDGQIEFGGKNTKWATAQAKPTKTEGANYLVISGGDGYEEFLTADQNPVSEVAGREDSTNHLLIWRV